MKMKAVVVGMISGILAASVAGFTPVYAADEDTNTAEAMQLADNDTESSGMSQDGMDKSSVKKDDAADGSDGNASDSSSDEATPDMATGDDDY